MEKLRDLVLVQVPNPALQNPMMYSPLGILYLAAVAEHAGFTCEIVDLRDGDKPIPPARWYGFSCTTPEIAYAKRLAKTLKAKTIVGGAHASLLPQDCKGYFDYVVRGEGEMVLPQILKRYYRKGSVVTAQRLDSLDTVPFPAWEKMEHPFSEELFPGERYGKAEKAGTVITSRGCPFHCAFCANIYRNPVIFRSPKNVQRELYKLRDLGIRHIRFEDDNFTLHPKFGEMCDLIKVTNVTYKCHGRSDLLTEKQARQLKLSGCEEYGLGVESADERVLQLMNKKANVTTHIRAIEILKEYGIRVKTYFIAGLPGETDETIELNKQFFLKTKPDKWTLSTFTPYPGSDTFTNPIKYGITITEPDYSKWWNFSQEGYNHVIIGQTPEEMWARYKEFYGWLRSDCWK